MGLFDITCIASGLPILSGQPSRLFFVQREAKQFVPITLPISGTYDRGGSIEAVKRNPNTRRIVAAFASLFRERRLTGGSPNEPLERPKDLKHLLEMVRQGAADHRWVEIDGAPVAYALIDDAFFRAAIEGRRAPSRAATSLLQAAFRGAAISRIIYADRVPAGLAENLREMAIFRDWFGARSWTPDLGGLQLAEPDIEKAIVKARKRLAGFPALVRVVDACLAATREKAASEFFESWSEDECEHFEKKWKLADLELPKLPTCAPPKHRAGDVFLGAYPSDAETLDRAIRKVKAGGRIVVRAGVHEQRAITKTNKPFTLTGEGMGRSVIVFDTGDDGLVLIGKKKWIIEGVALVSKVRKRHVGGDALTCSANASVRCVACLFGGTRGVLKRKITYGGVGARACEGAALVLRDCHLAFCLWGAAVHDTGSTLALENCRAYGCDYGLKATSEGRGRALRTRFEACARGAHTYGGGALDLEACRVFGSWGAGVYAEEGSLHLVRCELAGNGGAGLVSGPKSSVVARNCKARDNHKSGFELGGKVSLERTDAYGNAEHGIVVAADSEGEVRDNRCTKNVGFGIVRDPKSRVKVAGNDTKGNRRGGVRS